VEAPKALVGQEIENLRQQMMSNAGQSDASMFPDDLFEAEGKKRVLLGLIVGKIIRDNDIKLDSDRVDVTLDELATTYEDPEQFRQYYRSSKERLATIEAMVIEEQVVDWIKSKADVSTKEIGFDELMNTDNKEEG
jgi:trigger factor